MVSLYSYSVPSSPLLPSSRPSQLEVQPHRPPAGRLHCLHRSRDVLPGRPHQIHSLCPSRGSHQGHHLHPTSKDLLQTVYSSACACTRTRTCTCTCTAERHRCKALEKRRGECRCAVCGARSNLVCCLDCDAILCDNKYSLSTVCLCRSAVPNLLLSRNHLADHLRTHPDHNKLYSFKLRRQVCSLSLCLSLYLPLRRSHHTLTLAFLRSSAARPPAR
jgi:hypothetical protein